jgi:hypothetical protein
LLQRFTLDEAHRIGIASVRFLDQAVDGHNARVFQPAGSPFLTWSSRVSEVTVASDG